jgi:hypothetical protein
VRSRCPPKEGSPTVSESRLNGSRILPRPFALHQAVRDEMVHSARQRARWDQDALGEIAHPEAVATCPLEPQQHVIGVEANSVLGPKLRIENTDDVVVGVE